MLSRFKHLEFKRAVAARLAAESVENSPLPAGGKTQQAFIRALFASMGRLAKLDGRVSEEEIAYASSVMQQLGLDGRGRQHAIDCFYLGKLEQTDVLALLQELLPAVGRGSRLARQMLSSLCRLAYSKGFIRLKEKLLLREIAEQLGFDKSQLLTICTEIQVAESADHWQARQAAADAFAQGGEDSRFTVRRPGKLGQAYGILELRPDADDGEIRQAYRRMLNRYHPDKLASRTSSSDALRQAQEQFHAVRQAYETICGFRNKMVNP